MKILVKVKPNARENRVEEIDKNQLLVRVKAPAKQNKANAELIETLSEYFKVPKSQITILAGLKSNKKLIKIGQ
ncbi:MAG: DUF167 domain-containing protein [candidate division WOR-3 bacterium]